mmetsp:Transcript_2924/g.4484  ORF Transcript_2924/g.4484 Transcript_2924/m.4484 type:complete len:118 (-) Transcript_2924:804-1157(-)
MERWWLQNPFNSIHAIALANLGEQTSGLLMITALQYNQAYRGIVTKIECIYIKKCKGLITAISESNFQFEDLKINTDQKAEIVVVTELMDESKAVVCRVLTTWSISKVPTQIRKKKE